MEFPAVLMVFLINEVGVDGVGGVFPFINF